MRNLVERAEIHQADRLLELSPDSITDMAIQTFLPEDLETPERIEASWPQKLGFV